MNIDLHTAGITLSPPKTTTLAASPDLTAAADTFAALLVRIAAAGQVPALSDTTTHLRAGTCQAVTHDNPEAALAALPLPPVDWQHHAERAGPDSASATRKP